MRLYSGLTRGNEQGFRDLEIEIGVGPLLGHLPVRTAIRELPLASILTNP